MTTKTPRTRPGQKYPGGRHLRRALAKRHARLEGEQDGKRTTWGPGRTAPGSMKG